MTYFSITANYFANEMKFKIAESPRNNNLYEAYHSAREIAAEGFEVQADDVNLHVTVEELPGNYKGEATR